MKIRLFKMGWSRNCYRPSLIRAWSNKLWYLSLYKYSICLDFRKNWVNDMMGIGGE